MELLSVVLLLIVLITYVANAILKGKEANDEFLNAWKKEEERLRSYYDATIKARFESFKIEYYTEKFKKEGKQEGEAERSLRFQNNQNPTSHD